MPSEYGPRIVVPQKAIQGGTDCKFISDPYRLELHGMMSPEEYTSSIEQVNKRLKKARATFIDGALLVTGPLLVPLMLWGIRHRGQVKKRKRKLKKAILEFNAQYPHLLMRWNPKPESKLTIERRQEQQLEQHPSNGTVATAQLIGDVIVHAEPPQAPPSAATTTGGSSGLV